MKQFDLRLEKVCIFFASLIFGGILLYLLMMSMNSTSVCYEGEHTYYLRENPLWHILCVLAVTGITVLLKKKGLPKLSERFWRIFFGGIGGILVLLVLLTQLRPISDQEKVMIAAKQFLMENYCAWEPDGYAFYCRHQNGIILIMAGLLAVLGTNNYVGLQLLNAGLLWLSLYLVYRICGRVLKGSPRKNAVVFLFVPFWFFVTFVYGTVIGFAAMMATIFLALRYLDDGKRMDAFGAALFAAVAVTAKSNYYVMLIALAIVLAVRLFGRNWKRALLLLLLTAAFVTGAAKGVDRIIESRIGRELSAGQPAEVWIAMGLSEGWLAPGWINGMSDYLYRDSGFDREKTRWAARNYVGQFVERTKTQEHYAEWFFTRKNASQWNNPCFECFQILEDRGTLVSIPAWLQRILNTGTLSNRVLTEVWNYAQTVVLFGALLYLILAGRDRKIEELLFGIIFIGGFLFHVFWEACCTYTIPYFVLLIPYSAGGYELAANLLSAKTANRKSFMLPVVLAVLFGVLTWRSNLYFARFLPDNTAKYQQYLAGLRQPSPADGTYVLAPANSENTVLSLYEEDAPEGALVGVVMRDFGRSQTVCLAKVRELNGFEKYVNHTSAYYIWMEQNGCYLYADRKADAIVAQRFLEEDMFLWHLEPVSGDLYYIHSADGRVLEYSPVNGALCLREKENSKECQIWRLSVSD